MKETVEVAPRLAAPIEKPAGFAWVKELDRLLRGDSTRPSALGEHGLDVGSDRLHVAIIVLGIGYGLCMGLYALLRGDAGSLLQFLSGAVKVPALFLLTLLVTFPSLYVFNALVGSRLSAVALWRLLTSSVALNMAVLASFGPIVAFFSMSTTSYSFMLLLNVLVFAVAGAFGLSFLLKTLHRLTLRQQTPEPPNPTAPPVMASAETAAASGPLDAAGNAVPSAPVKFVFRCWMLVFGLVGAQMGWVLRPFLGSPDQPFSFFRSRDSNFFEAVWSHITHLLGW
jgi:hypothetical protein